MGLDFDTALKVFSFAMSVAAMVYAWFASRRKDVDRRLDEGSKRMDEHDLRLQAVEQTISSLPTGEDVHGINLALVRMEGQLEKLGVILEGNGELMARLDRIVTRHEEHLLGGAGK